jgi:hypothetical protein
MFVTSQCNGNRVTGLYVGASNVRRYFRRHVASIELQIDHLRIACGLTPHFWLDQPEIHDPRLCAWLESKHRDRKERRGPVLMALIPSGKNSFILSTAGLEAQMQEAQIPDAQAEHVEAANLRGSRTRDSRPRVTQPATLSHAAAGD